MAKLLNSENQILIEDLKVAKAMWERMRGLLGTKELPSTSGLWIHQCNSIHTFFMNYAIDCVFLDSKMKVKALRSNVKPGRMTLPIWGAQTVIELQSGSIERLKLSLGDQLHVGT